MEKKKLVSSRDVRYPLQLSFVRSFTTCRPLAYHIMEMWDRDAIDMIEPGWIEFTSDNGGSFGFIAVRGFVDARFAERDGLASVGFSWQGDDDGHPVSGRGTARLKSDGTLVGRIFFHMGDDSEFVATRA